MSWSCWQLPRCWATLGLSCSLSEAAYQMICKVLGGLMGLGNSSMHSLCFRDPLLFSGACSPCHYWHYKCYWLSGFLLPLSAAFDSVFICGSRNRKYMLIISTHRQQSPAFTGDLRSMSTDKRITFECRREKQKHFPCLTASPLFVSIRPRKRVQLPIFLVLTFLFPLFIFFLASSTLHANKMGNFWGRRRRMEEFLDRRQ